MPRNDGKKFKQKCLSSVKQSRLFEYALASKVSKYASFHIFKSYRKRHYHNIIANYICSIQRNLNAPEAMILNFCKKKLKFAHFSFVS